MRAPSGKWDSSYEVPAMNHRRWSEQKEKRAGKDGAL
jgi:hypothetical protein